MFRVERDSWVDVLSDQGVCPDSPFRTDVGPRTPPLFGTGPLVCRWPRPGSTYCSSGGRGVFAMVGLGVLTCWVTEAALGLPGCIPVRGRLDASAVGSLPPSSLG